MAMSMSGSHLFLRPERRNYPRLSVDLPVDLTIDGQKVCATASNISCGGLFLPIKNKQLKENSPCEITVSLPNATHAVKVSGEIARTEPGSRWFRRSHGTAIRFKGLYDDNMLEIEKFIKNKLH